MKRLSVCTDGKAHIFDVRLLDVTGALSELVHVRCRYCNISWEDILDELERQEERSQEELESWEAMERDCGA